MNLRSLPLPGFFIVFAVALAATLGTFLAVRRGPTHGGIWDHPHALTFVLLAVLVVGVATLATALEARRRKRDQPSEPSRYQLALQTGQVSGDISGWYDRVRRERRFAAVGWLGLGYFLWLGGTAVLNGPRWAAVVILALAALTGWGQWRSQRRLKALERKLAAASD